MFSYQVQSGVQPMPSGKTVGIQERQHFSRRKVRSGIAQTRNRYSGSAKNS
jgi:hypothetical protein